MINAGMYNAGMQECRNVVIFIPIVTCGTIVTNVSIFLKNKFRN
jgi:hypothetical protein